MPKAVRVFHIVGDQFTELQTPPDRLPEKGYLWVATTRAALESSIAELQAFLQATTGASLFELHVLDLLNRQFPSSFDYTSTYDLLVFRRLTAVVPADNGEEAKPAGSGAAALSQVIQTSAVGFVVFDRILLSVHPTDCQVREYFAQRLQGQTASIESRAGLRMPVSPPDLMLRMVNHMVDSYLQLRRLLGKQIEELQQQLFAPRARPGQWHLLLEWRNALHLLEDTCEDQRAAIVEWIDALEEWPQESDPAAQREREALRVRSRDVLEHIERVLSHVRRLESSSETAVQIHFSEQSNRTNAIMRTLTTLTAIFLPLNLVTGFFGMNFEGLPLIHSRTGFWIAAAIMLVLGVGMSVYFWRKRYLGRS
ncbi:MAG TPA: magnesium transporter CorA family protein [Caldimonas sp.]|jgi:Mg2+ and Co2+ transporter CorA|nr:magnesium transporter CorA family protein [Caldimonas sp.]HEX2540448.1 magnesium transporter CorA family protein [Caldimonas sp.]